MNAAAARGAAVLALTLSCGRSELSTLDQTAIVTCVDDKLTCVTDAECCSGWCSAGRCYARAFGCRPDGAPCGPSCCAMTCDAHGRCGRTRAPTSCLVGGDACKSDGDCCTGHCDSGACRYAACYPGDSPVELASFRGLWGEETGNHLFFAASANLVRISKYGGSLTLGPRMPDNRVAAAPQYVYWLRGSDLPSDPVFRAPVDTLERETTPILGLGGDGPQYSRVSNRVFWFRGGYLYALDATNPASADRFGPAPSQGRVVEIGSKVFVYDRVGADAGLYHVLESGAVTKLLDVAPIGVFTQGLYAMCTAAGSIFFVDGDRLVKTNVSGVVEAKALIDDYAVDLVCTAYGVFVIPERTTRPFRMRQYSLDLSKAKDAFPMGVDDSLSALQGLADDSCLYLSLLEPKPKGDNSVQHLWKSPIPRGLE